MTRVSKKSSVSKSRKAIRRKDTSSLIKIQKPFIQVPYSLIRSKEFRELSPIATKIYMKVLSLWSSANPNYPIPLSYRNIAKMCHCSNDSIVEANAELMKDGFVTVITEHKRTNRYLVENKWFTGDYK